MVNICGGGLCMNSPYKNAVLRLVEIQGLQLFSSMHWAMACVLAGQ